MKTITFPIGHRLNYLIEFIESLKKNNLSEYDIFCSVEPIKEMEENINRIKSNNILNCKSLNIITNTVQQGVRQNPKNALDAAFGTGSNFNIHLEDDLLISPDAINLADWYYNLFYPNPMAYMNYGLFNYDSNPEEPHKIITIPNYEGLGWCCFKENWNACYSRYWFDDSLAIKHFRTVGWDWAVNGAFKEYGYSGLKPVLSRTNHNGRERGTYCQPSFHDEKFKNLKYNKEVIITDFNLGE